MSISTSDIELVEHAGEGVKKLSLPPFSVLMAVYHADTPNFFDESLRSIFSQTLLPAQLVLVCDGRLTEELEAIVQRYSSEYPQILHVVRTPSEQNQGLGKALAMGLSECSYELVARMDSDDICVQHRFARQIEYMVQHPELDMLSSAIVEFTDNPDESTTYRYIGSTHDKLSRIARYRNPINHPAVVFRKSRIEAVGGYVHYPLLEDYHLIARLLLAGGRLDSLNESLLYFRTTKDTYCRRRGRAYLKNEIKLQRYFYRIGFISGCQYLLNVGLRIPMRMMPPKLLEWFYTVALRLRKIKSN